LVTGDQSAFLALRLKNSDRRNRRSLRTHNCCSGRNNFGALETGGRRILDLHILVDCPEPEPHGHLIDRYLVRQKPLTIPAILLTEYKTDA